MTSTTGLDFSDELDHGAATGILLRIFRDMGNMMNFVQN